MTCRVKLMNCTGAATVKGGVYAMEDEDRATTVGFRVMLNAPVCVAEEVIGLGESGWFTYERRTDEPSQPQHVPRTTGQDPG